MATPDTLRADRPDQGATGGGNRGDWRERRPRDARPQGDDRRLRGSGGSADRPAERRSGRERPEFSPAQPRSEGDWRKHRPTGERAPRLAGSRGDRTERQDRRGAGDPPDWRDRHPSGDRRAPTGRAMAPRRPDRDRPPPAPAGPELPEWADHKDLDPAARGALRGLDPRNAERVARHLVAAGSLVDEDPAAALQHARAARDRASRVAAVREAVGVAAYHAGDYAEAARELRAYRRMSGDRGYRAVLADCERALGRPEVALRLVAEALDEPADADETVELRLVEAGARRDLGEVAAARLVLEAALGGRPTPDSLAGADPARLRVAAAYADLLQAEGERQRADEWFAAIAAADPEDRIGAVERLGVQFTEVETVEDALDADAVPTAGAEPGERFAAEVEAEVAELLGEAGPPSADEGRSSAR